MNRLFLLFTIFAFIASGLTSAQSSQADAEEIRSLLESRDDEIKELLGPEDTEYTQEQRDQLRSMINDIIDFEAMAAYALGSTFDEISEDDREEFVSLFATIIRDQSLNRLDIYRAEVSYEEIEVDNGSAKVYTIARLQNVRTPVDYTMIRENSEWVITDMIIDEVSTAESYNRQFQSIIRQRGFDALLESMRRRAART
jgi:phospholipid transport system substrate-binding protein